MFVKSFFLKDSIMDLEVLPINFDKTTILVGASGSGKTTIVSALLAIKEIAKGTSSPGDEWGMTFLDGKNREIEWKGRFSSEFDISEENEDLSKIEEETLSIDGKVAIERTSDSVIYNGNKLPTVDRHRSSIYIFRDDDLISDIFKSIESITLVTTGCISHTDEKRHKVISAKMLKEFKSMGDKGMSSKDVSSLIPQLNCRDKMYYAFKHDKESFDDFEFLYTSIFPNVKKIIPHLTRRSSENIKSADSKLISIKLELHNNKDVSQEWISSGMFKTMMILADIHFSDDDQMIVIDEIENSLGVNCLPDVINAIKTSRMQSIVSTHHPKIINGIPSEMWRVVSRKDGKISCTKAEEITNSTSKHDNFLQLINSSIYQNGVQ